MQSLINYHEKCSNILCLIQKAEYCIRQAQKSIDKGRLVEWYTKRIEINEAIIKRLKNYYLNLTTC